MSRARLAAAGLLVGAFLGLGGWFLAGRDEKPSPSTQARTSGGALTFTLPDTWRTLDCEVDEGDCVRVATPDMAEEQAATVSFLPPNPVEGTPVDALLASEVDVPGRTPITVDGLPAMRLDPGDAGQDTILVAGRARVAAGSVFMVVCPLGGDATRARDLCDQVVRTLKVTR